MPSHDFSFVNPLLLLLPSSFPFHPCALSLWMTAWLQSPSLPRPNLSNVVFQSLAWQQFQVFSNLDNKFSELEADGSSHALCESPMCHQPVKYHCLGQRNTQGHCGRLSRTKKNVRMPPTANQWDRPFSVPLLSFTGIPLNNVPAYTV